MAKRLKDRFPRERVKCLFNIKFQEDKGRLAFRFRKSVDKFISNKNIVMNSSALNKN